MEYYVFCLRPGLEELLGTAEEYIEVEDFLDAIKVYALTGYYMLGV